MPLAPEVARLVPELFRRVAIPYSKGFSQDNQRALSEIVQTGLAGHRAARKQIVIDRLKKAPDGGEHLDEFAVEFGFLEEVTGNYIVGRYGLMGAYIDGAASRHRQFNRERSLAALMLYVLLDRHGDCLLALLATVEAPGSRTDSFRKHVRDILEHKATAWHDCDLPRNAAYREGARKYDEYLVEWGCASPWPRRVIPRYGPQPNELSRKTTDGYAGRTSAYAASLGLVRSSGTASSLSDSGKALITALEQNGFSPGSAVGLSPTFEAIHDAFSVDYPKYAANFIPLTHGRLERITGAAVLPGRPLVPWRDLPDITNEYAHIVGALNEALSGSARLDAVRLAMLLYAIGRGVVPALDDDPDGAYELNANAAVAIAGMDSRRYSLGHARSGRRLWSVALLRH